MSIFSDSFWTSNLSSLSVDAVECSTEESGECSLCNTVGVWTRFMSGSIVLVMLSPRTFFVRVRMASGMLCVVDSFSVDSRNSWLLTGEDGLFSEEEDISCISPRWSPLAPRVMFTRKLPTVLRAPRVSEMRENADCDKSRPWSSSLRRRRLTLGSGNTSSSERSFNDPSNSFIRRPICISTPSSSPSATGWCSCSGP